MQRKPQYQEYYVAQGLLQRQEKNIACIQFLSSIFKYVGLSGFWKKDADFQNVKILQC